MLKKDRNKISKGLEGSLGDNWSMEPYRSPEHGLFLKNEHGDRVWVRGGTKDIVRADRRLYAVLRKRRMNPCWRCSFTGRGWLKRLLAAMRAAMADIDAARAP